MVSNEPLQVRGLGEIRADLSHVLRQFASMGVDAPEFFFGRHRKPEGVVISYDRWRQLTGQETGAQPRASATPPRRRQDRAQRSPLPGKGLDEVDPALFTTPASELSDEQLIALGRSAHPSDDDLDDVDLERPSVSAPRDSDAAGRRRRWGPSSTDG